MPRFKGKLGEGHEGCGDPRLAFRVRGLEHGSTWR